MMKIALLVVVLGLSNAAPRADPCCAPDQFEGIVDVITGSAFQGKATESEVNSMVSYDFTNMRLSATIEMQEGSMKVMNRTIFDFKKHRMYNFDINTLACTSMNFDGEFQKACVPSGATPAGDFYYGLGSDKLNAKAFKFMVPQTSLSGFYVVTSSCIPVTEIAFGMVGEVSILTTAEVVDVTEGIKDLSVFIPPATCASLKEKELKKATLKRGPLGFPIL